MPETTAAPIGEWKLSDLEFCGFVCMAARRLTIPIVYKEQEGKTLYVFIDRGFGKMIGGSPLLDKQAALKSACEALVQYLKV